MKKIVSLFLLLIIIICTANNGIAKNITSPKDSAALNKEGLTLPAGFSAMLFADNLGVVRHIAVTGSGDIYAKLERLKDGNGILWLHDNNGDGKMDEKKGFGNYIGTGISVSNEYLYTSSNEEVYRYKLDAGGKVINTAAPEKIITGLVNKHQHESKSITLDDAGNIYVNIGAYSNACQEKDRTKGSPGMNPCPILQEAGGIWKFKIDKLNQRYGDGVKYATGLRNVVGLDWNKSANKLFVMQHGRDQLNTLFPDFFSDQQSAELPAECMYALNEGDDCGWPYMYYDQQQKKKLLMPEYGGDGRKPGGENANDPAIAFPGHLAPNALLFYTGNMFPEKYKNGAFIAFHGSWNRAPEPQKGFFVAFVPFKDGKPSGDWEIFADGFSGKEMVASPGQAKYRPCGLAQGPDGALYVSDDAHGAIFKITYK